jgi:hypothetical protein
VYHLTDHLSGSSCDEADSFSGKIERMLCIKNMKPILKNPVIKEGEGNPVTPFSSQGAIGRRVTNGVTIVGETP